MTSIERVLLDHQLDPRPGTTPGGNPSCLCGWSGLGHCAHVAGELRRHLLEEAAVERAAVRLWSASLRSGGPLPETQIDLGWRMSPPSIRRAWMEQAREALAAATDDEEGTA